MIKLYAHKRKLTLTKPLDETQEELIDFVYFGSVKDLEKALVIVEEILHECGVACEVVRS